MTIDDLKKLKPFDMVELMKRGNKIKIDIKKRNNGKFTEYCGGNVTQKCIDEVLELVGLKDVEILEPSKNILKKLVVFCPVDHAEKVRTALFSAGAGHIGNYDSCSFNTSGAGSFKANENANPFVGELNKLHFERKKHDFSLF